MNDSGENKALDIFGMSDIDKIQAEIERDLEKADAALTKIWDAPPVVSENFVEPENFLGSDMFSSDEPLEFLTDRGGDFDEIQPDVDFSPPEIYGDDIVPVEANPVSIPQTDSFYRETIKDIPSKKSGIFSTWRKTAVFLLVCTLGTSSLGFGLGFGWGFVGRNFDNSEAGEAVAAGITTLTTTHYVFENVQDDPTAGSLADIVEFLEPSVVNIIAYTENNFRGLDQHPGSGIIFAENDERIFIVTNNYVVRGSERVTVSISGSSPLEARPVGSDPTADLNVISVDKTQLLDAGITSVVIATFGDSDQMRVGDTVLAIGNAMGEGNSVTRGVISAPETSVEIQGRESPMMLLQTDAAINYGNSGGPLINTRGEVIGININVPSSLIFGMSQVEGMGYSISSNVAAPILNRLINYRPGLGITGRSVNYEIADQWGIPVLGVYIFSVIENQSAYNAGLMASDIITGFNGLPVFNWDQLVDAIRTSEIGDMVEVRVLRNGRNAITLTVELGKFIQENF